MVEPLGLSVYQKRVLTMPENLDLLLFGGRGGGKSWAMALLILRHITKYDSRARVLFVRKTFAGLRDFEGVLREVFGLVYGTGARFNSQEHLWRLPNGATVELNQLEGPGDLAKYQGRSFSMLCADEVAQYADPADLEILRSNLRGPSDVPLRIVWACNPGGCGHGWLHRRFIAKAEPWTSFADEPSGREFVLCPSTYEDNEFIDRAEYRRQLESATAHDPELQRAWLLGQWNIEAGSYFGACLDKAKVSVDQTLWTPERLRKVMAPPPETRHPAKPGSAAAAVDAMFHRLEPDEDLVGNPPEGWRPGFELYLAMDFGVSAPSVCYVMARSRGCQGPDGHWYPAGSVVAVDEWSHHRPDRLNEGCGLSVPSQAAEIKQMCRRWGMRPRGTCDDAIFSRQRGHDVATIADEFREAGVTLSPAKKGGRVTGWTLMRSALSRAGSIDEAGLYISRACEYAWQTLPFLERNPRHPEDLDSSGPCHGADAIRYGLLWSPPAGVTFQKIQGYF